MDRLLRDRSDIRIAKGEPQVAMQIDLKGAAERIRGLISMSDKARVANAATRLGVDERQLRDALDATSVPSTLAVVSAIVRLYGLDPTWVLTGTYDANTHRIALQQDPQAIEQLLTQLIADRADSDTSPSATA